MLKAEIVAMGVFLETYILGVLLLELSSLKEQNKGEALTGKERKSGREGR